LLAFHVFVKPTGILLLAVVRFSRTFRRMDRKACNSRLAGFRYKLSWPSSGYCSFLRHFERFIPAINCSGFAGLEGNVRLSPRSPSGSNSLTSKMYLFDQAAPKSVHQWLSLPCQTVTRKHHTQVSTQVLDRKRKTCIAS